MKDPTVNSAGSCCKKSMGDDKFVVAQWPISRIKHWEILNQVRAIENQIFVACVNSCGTAGETIYGGHSALIDS